MYCEISQKAFHAICPAHMPCQKMENLSHATKSYWNYKGVNLMTIYNYLSRTTQYYVQDINS